MRNLPSQQCMLYLCDALKRYPGVDFSQPNDQQFNDHDLIFNVEYSNMARAMVDAEFLYQRGFVVCVMPSYYVVSKNYPQMNELDVFFSTQNKWNLQARIKSVLDLRLITNNFFEKSKMINELIERCYRLRYIRDKTFPLDDDNWGEHSATMSYRREWTRRMWQGIEQGESMQDVESSFR